MIRVPDDETAASIAATQPYIVLTNQKVASRFGLSPLALAHCSTADVYALHRKTLLVPGRTEQWIDALRQSIIE